MAAVLQLKINNYILETRISFLPNAGQLGLGSSRPESSRLGSSRPGPILKKVSEYDQEIPQSQTADNPMAP